MATQLSPWLNISPEQFTNAAIAGAQLGSRTATDAAEIAQRGILGAEEIANKAEQLQVQRENIAADLAARQAAASQRANEAAAEIGLKQQAFDLEKAAQAEAGARIAQKDALWQEGLSRYQRAINAGDDPAAADLEIIQPLRDVGVGPNSKMSSPKRSGAINVGGGEIGYLDPQGNYVTARDANPKTGTAAKFDEATKLRIGKLKGEISNAQRAFNNPDTPRSRRLELAAEIEKKNAEWEALVGGSQATPEVTTPPQRLPVGYIGAPRTGTGNQMVWPPSSGTMIPPMPGEAAAPASSAPVKNYPTATNKKTGATVIFRNGKWQTP